MIDKKYFRSVPVETTRESIRVEFLKANNFQKRKKKMSLLDGMIVAIIPISLLLAVIFWMAF